MLVSSRVADAFQPEIVAVKEALHLAYVSTGEELSRSVVMIATNNARTRDTGPF